MGYRRFDLLLLLRLGLLGLSLAAFAFLFVDPRFHSATLLMFLVAAAQGYELWLFLMRTNREVARFLSAARYADFSQSFAFEGAGGGFQELGEAFTDILERLKEQRRRQEVELRQLRAMLDHNPVPLISLRPDGAAALLNNAARRLFAGMEVTKLEDLRRCGEAFYRQLTHLRAGEKRLVEAALEGGDTKLSITATDISSEAGKLRLVSLQDIGRELEATQLRAWQDLVRVLTHEIMNSITPVASLAQTAAELAGDVAARVPGEHPWKRDLDRIDDASHTVARRAENLIQFVSNYRKLTRLPEPEKRKILLRELFDHVVKILRAEACTEVRIHAEVIPPGLELHADPEQLEQALINLLQNAEEALRERGGGEILVLARLGAKGRVTIEVRDNGPGIEPAILDRIFVPYFTTKPGGSGIGLALARQVLISHGGTIRASSLPAGGARFILSF